MKKIVIITPVYNDWESFVKLIKEIDKVISNFKNISFKLIAVNDGSSEKVPEIQLPPHINTVEILNMKINQGHAISLANGIKYALNNYEFESLILMDADGEDRPVEISDLINKANELKNISIVAKRVKRSEGPIFTILYNLHKILTFLFTGKLMNFGNFSLITKKDAEIIIRDPTIVYCFSSTLKNKINKLGNINCIRGKRYFGPSKMPLIKLIIHSFSIIAVFKMRVFIRSALFLVLLTYLHPYIGGISSLLQIFIVIFNILIYLIAKQSDETRLKNMDNELVKTEKVTH
ncbi:MAG: glycosyl transferase [Candidatus Pelagibacter sp.]|nr:glycosyl transferase [Candidatus Pelagibacter sp.]